MTIGRKIKHLRVDQDLTLEELAKSANTNRNTLSLLENGLSNNVSYPTLTRIADVFRVSITWLIDEDQGYPPPERVEKKRERSRR